MVFTLSRITKKLKTFKTLTTNMKLDGSIGTFVQKVNTLTGRMGWVLEDEYYDYHQEIARSMYADMLHDTDRNEKYYIAIKKAIEEMHSRNKKAHVLDIGTGTGLLSMMAANCGADTIVACEGFPPMAEIARCLVQDNCLGEKIKIISKRSTQLRVGVDLEQKANILVTEVFDTELIGEGAIETFNHANEHLLEDDSIVVPWAARVYCQVLESDLLQSANKIRSKFLIPPGRELRIPYSMTSCPGTSAVHDIQLNQVSQDDVKILSPPIQIFKYNFCNSRIPYDESSKTSFEATSSGMCTNIAFWWELDMDSSGETVISLAPSSVKSTPWRDHWMQAVYHLPKSMPVKQGAQMELVALHDKYSNFFHLFEKQSKIPEELAPPSCSCGLHTSISRTRLMAVNDIHRWHKYLTILANLQSVSVAVYIGDFSLLPFAAAHVAQKVYCVQENPVSYKIMQSIILENNFCDKVILLPKYDKSLIQGEVDVVLSEPFFRDTIYPWDNCRVWFMWQSIASRRHSTILPVKCRICCMPLQLEHLHKIRSPCKQVCGFTLHAFDKLIEKSSERSDNDVETQPLWEYTGTALALPSLMAVYDFRDTPPESAIINSGNVEITHEGTCNGIAIWVDWVFGEEIITTGPIKPVIPGEFVEWDKGTRQGIYFMKHTPSTVVCGDKISHEATLDPVAGNFLFDFLIKKNENTK